MADGTSKPIAQLREGDMVLAADPTTGVRAARRVLRVWVHDQGGPAGVELLDSWDAVMRYSDVEEIDSAYALIARLAQPDDPDDSRAHEAMTIAAALVRLGEDRSWASVWWAYGALHYEMSDEALARALELLARVERPDQARAAALMLTAEIRYAQAVYADDDPSPIEQRDLLGEAVALAPDWPALQLRLARASKVVGEQERARQHAAEAVALLEAEPTSDPFDSAITGRNLDRSYVMREFESLGLG